MVFMTGLDAFANAHRLHSSLNSFGGWEKSSSYLRHMRSMREKGLISWQDSSEKIAWVPQLTQTGKASLPESIDPTSFWNQDWSGNWRTLTFDLPADERKERKRLNRWLQENKFGHLQGSLWLTARKYEDWSTQLGSLNIDPRSVIFIEGKPLGNLTDALIVEKAWDFTHIANLQEEYLRFLENRTPIAAQFSSQDFAAWFRDESELWRSVMSSDPLLPSPLHPANYQGQLCWQKRRSAFSPWRDILCS
ncbi:PaaX-like protein C-terminal domain [Verrucomicrobiia bacterium DG1235]|nr:PaaX-like protein C-terminal domain [Verrucomicrobiae bacterium DG1235]